MNIQDKKTSQLKGPASYENWRCFLAGKPALARSEFELFTDTWVIGAVTSGLGPYQFFNLVPIGKTEIVRAAIVLRYSYYLEFDVPKIEKTDSSRYHGGSPTDEIAALASLLIGCRVYAGTETREFRQGDEPEGHPISRSLRPIPVLKTGNRLILPSVRGEHSLMSLEKMASYPNISSTEATVLVRSARLYQDALWIAESQPHLAWLMLVSAIEVVANDFSSSAGSALERLCASQPKLVSLLEESGVPGLSQKVAELLVNYIGSTKKFVDFLMAHLPEPPTVRPDVWAQVEWSRDNLSSAFRLIYDHRSKALHDGIPFPAPMCELPFSTKVGKTISEKPIGLGGSTCGGQWLIQDTPMNLSTFEYIVRHSLLKWWETLSNRARK